ncbi:SET domain-containing protein [Meredithblackwellia eburnea MCA 4105]
MAAEQLQEVEAIWQDLLTWLESYDRASEPIVKHIKLVKTIAGRGLVANGPVPPDTVLINIPSRALLNTATLRPLYPATLLKKLTSTQAVSLHLSLQATRNPQSNRQQPDRDNNIYKRDEFTPFLRSLPTAFPTVPLDWSIRSKTRDQLRTNFNVPQDDPSLPHTGGDDDELVPPAKRRKLKTLLELLPPGVKVRADDVEKRFLQDWLKVSEVWAEQRAADPDETDKLVFLDYFIAWLNVNTRCVYYDLGGKTSDNLTLAPIIDMINHRKEQQTKPLQRALSLSFSSPALTSTDLPLTDGVELGFSYGPHEDSMLLTEYGFTLGPQNPYNNVVIDDEVEKLFALRGEEGELKVGVLKDESYWGDMTFQSPGTASWRILVALRLLHLRIPRRAGAGSGSTILTADAFEPWYDVLSGTTDLISAQSEVIVQADLRRIAGKVAKAREEGVGKCEDVEKVWKLEKEENKLELECLEMLKGIWKEEQRLAEAVKKGED